MKTYPVRSQSKSNIIYLVDVHDTFSECTCEHFKFKHDCKHVKYIINKYYKNMAEKQVFYREPLQRDVYREKYDEINQEAKDLLEKTRFFENIMSSGKSIKCDADEIAVIVESIQTGSPVKLRRGLFNPSFWVATVEDSDRYEKFKSETYSVLEHNNQCLNYGNKDKIKLLDKPEMLKDIFEGVPMSKNKLVDNSIKQIEQL